MINSTPVCCGCTETSRTSGKTSAKR
jgi:hypothetical protein